MTIVVMPVMTRLSCKRAAAPGDRHSDGDDRRPLSAVLNEKRNRATPALSAPKSNVMRATAPTAMMQDRAICFHRRVSKLAAIYQRLFQPRKPTCTVCSISPPVKRRVERTTHASSSVQSQLDPNRTQAGARHSGLCGANLAHASRNGEERHGISCCNQLVIAANRRDDRTT